jgi:hypothetical protein
LRAKQRDFECAKDTVFAAPQEIGVAKDFRQIEKRLLTKGTASAVPQRFPSAALPGLRVSLAIAERVPQGRLNLAQDAVLGTDSTDEKSRRDD